MQLPSGWAVETSDDGSSAIGKLPGTEDEVSVTEFGSRVADETPAEHLQRYIKELSVPEPPEVRNVLPFTPFAMPGGQPATTRIQDLGDDVFVIEYAIALPAGRMFTINFYRMGAPGPETERYSDLIRNARFDSSESDET
ncbi:hypothetical protein LF41_3040 [Lysobacter dokdonensis DS-58]|uniref:Uncharacterized protein n=2 Tax=Noviluteimonas TaxID=3382693 RepID=A0A0A2WM75_9GAMM|nr:hypothetical protein LF41_3040 [Lysobacter dokdonensis DS-58]